MNFSEFQDCQGRNIFLESYLRIIGSLDARNHSLPHLGKTGCWETSWSYSAEQETESPWGVADILSHFHGILFYFLFECKYLLLLSDFFSENDFFFCEMVLNMCACKRKECLGLSTPPSCWYTKTPLHFQFLAEYCHIVTCQ